MWEKQSRDTDFAQEQKRRLHAALTPPAETHRAPRGLLNIQLLLSAALAAALFLALRLAPGWAETLRQQINVAFGQGIELGEGHPLVRFAAALQGGKGGGLAASWPDVPPGCAEESFCPQTALLRPTAWYDVTSAYGWRENPLNGEEDFHTGIDLAAVEGRPIGAALAGCVLEAGRNASYGNFVRLLHADGVETRYCHMQYVFVRVGETVAQGQLLGTVGSTGAATGPHLHFELLREDVRYDPARALGL